MLTTAFEKITCLRVGSFGRYSHMNSNTDFLNYPLVIKRVYDYVTVSVPDLGIAAKVPLPKEVSASASVTEFLLEESGNFRKLLLQAIFEAYAEAEKHMKTKKWQPYPSSIRNQLKTKEKDYSLPEFKKKIGEHMNISENTLRREIKKGRIIAYITEGGHRRIPESEVSRYLELVKSSQQ